MFKRTLQSRRDLADDVAGKANWQRAAVPLNVTCVPGACGDAGLGAFHVTEVQGTGGGGGVPLVVTA